MKAIRWHARQDIRADDVPDPIPRAIEQSMQGMTQAASIIAAMKQFAQPDGAEKLPTDLNHALQTTVVVTRHEWVDVAEVVLDLDENLPMVPCFRGAINQVFVNLITNASHAVASVAQATCPKGTIAIRSRLHDGSVEIQVADSGPGIPETIRQRVFDPFFTTKRVGKGTGQGLFVARNVVHGHGGTLGFESVPGIGTTFVMRIPVRHPGGDGT